MVNFVSSSFAPFRAINYVFPVFGPFLSPLKISLALWTFFCQFEFHFWFCDLNLVNWSGKPCFNFLPETLFLHILNEDCFKFERIIWITSFSFKSNWKAIASKGVLSSHAISMMRSTSSGFRFLGRSNTWFFRKYSQNQSLKLYVKPSCS